MSTTGAGAPFHQHSSAWLYLAGGAKRWFVAPWDQGLPTSWLWAAPAHLQASRHILEVGL